MRERKREKKMWFSGASPPTANAPAARQTPRLTLEAALERSSKTFSTPEDEEAAVGALLDAEGCLASARTAALIPGSITSPGARVVAALSARPEILVRLVTEPPPPGATAARRFKRPFLATELVASVPAVAAAVARSDGALRLLFPDPDPDLAEEEEEEKKKEEEEGEEESSSSSSSSGSSSDDDGGEKKPPSSPIPAPAPAASAGATAFQLGRASRITRIVDAAFAAAPRRLEAWLRARGPRRFLALAAPRALASQGAAETLARLVWAGPEGAPGAAAGGDDGGPAGAGAAEREREREAHARWLASSGVLGALLSLALADGGGGGGEHPAPPAPSSCASSVDAASLEEAAKFASLIVAAVARTPPELCPLSLPLASGSSVARLVAAAARGAGAPAASPER